MKITKVDPCSVALPPPGTVVPSPKKPLAVAEWFLDRWSDQTRPMVVKGRDKNIAYYQFNGLCWDRRSDTEVRREMYATLRRCVWPPVNAQGQLQTPIPWDPDDTKLGHLTDAMKHTAPDYTDVESNTWTAGDEKPLVLPCESGLIRISDGTLLDHTPDFFCTHLLPARFDPKAKCPKTDRFVRHLCNSDKESQKTLWEWTGYCLSGSHRYQKGLIIKGVTGCGKGVYARLLNLIVGDRDYAGFKVSDFTGNFSKVPLMDKSVVTFSDNRTDLRNKLFVDLILEVIGRDASTIRRPYDKDALSLYLPCRFTLLTNYVPMIEDDSGAFVRRFIALESVHAPEEVIPNYEEELFKELPGIINRMLQGLRSLASRDGFTQPAVSKWILETMDESSSIEKEFLRERCEFGPICEAYRVDVDVLHSEYLWYCGQQGEKAMLKKRFLEACTAMPWHIEKHKRGGKKDAQGHWIEQQRMVLEGIRLKATEPRLRVVKDDGKPDDE